jgi:hypothetical protein
MTIRMNKLVLGSVSCLLARLRNETIAISPTFDV